MFTCVDAHTVREQVGSKWLRQTVATCERFDGPKSSGISVTDVVRQRVSGRSGDFASRRSPVRSRLAPLSRTACRFHVSEIARGSSRFIADQAQGASWVQQIRHRAEGSAPSGAPALIPILVDRGCFRPSAVKNGRSACWPQAALRPLPLDGRFRRTAASSSSALAARLPGSLADRQRGLMRASGESQHCAR
jgi:hypothetical protein